jgi:hypothetical protein
MNGDEFNDWLEEQKGRIRVICERHRRRAGNIFFRSGDQDQQTVPTGPYNLVPNGLDERRVNVFLWVQGDAQHRVCAHRGIFAFSDAVIARLPLRDHFENGTPYLHNGVRFRSMWLPDLMAFEEGRHCFASIEDFDRGFPW